MDGIRGASDEKLRRTFFLYDKKFLFGRLQAGVSFAQQSVDFFYKRDEFCWIVFIGRLLAQLVPALLISHGALPDDS